MHFSSSKRFQKHETTKQALLLVFWWSWKPIFWRTIGPSLLPLCKICRQYAAGNFREASCWAIYVIGNFREASGASCRMVDGRVLVAGDGMGNEHWWWLSWLSWLSWLLRLLQLLISSPWSLCSLQHNGSHLKLCVTWNPIIQWCVIQVLGVGYMVTQCNGGRAAPPIFSESLTLCTWLHRNSATPAKLVWVTLVPRIIRSWTTLSTMPRPT